MICSSLNEKEAATVLIMLQALLHFSSKLCCSIVTSALGIQAEVSNKKIWSSKQVHRSEIIATKKKGKLLFWALGLHQNEWNNFHSQTPGFSKQLYKVLQQ